MCKIWNGVYQGKEIVRLFQQGCMAIWNTNFYKSKRKYLMSFQNWRMMFVLRPRIRFDGLYVCKMKYMRTGLAEETMSNPVHQVNYFRYVRFFPNGQTQQLISNTNPSKLDKVLQKEFSSANHGEFQVENDSLFCKLYSNQITYEYSFEVSSEGCDSTDETRKGGGTGQY